MCESPSEERKAFFRFVTAWSFHTGARHGGCLALVDANSTVLAVALCFPPDVPYNPGIFDFLRSMMKTGATPKDMDKRGFWSG